jgi:putative ABC transport system permease protein
VVALFLATIGIYGVLAYQVTQRRREMGIRLALGSDSGGIFRLILREGALLLAIGFAAGQAGAFALRDTISAQLYDVQPMDPLVVAVMAIILAAVGLLACAIPARRAAKIDPLIALTDQ